MITLVNAFTNASYSTVCPCCGLGAGTVSGEPSSPDRSVVSLGFDVEQEGAMEICQNCAVEAGVLAGCLPPHPVQDLREAAAAATARAEAAEEELHAVRGLNSALVQEQQFHEQREADALAEGFRAGKDLVAEGARE